MRIRARIRIHLRDLTSDEPRAFGLVLGASVDLVGDVREGEGRSPQRVELSGGMGEGGKAENSQVSRSSLYQRLPFAENARNLTLDRVLAVLGQSGCTCLVS